ncbi:MAG: FKBP-type peptidyl-prolyl cis-trans isomerase [Candidatus Heimdallarchaeaceae archaeon]
MVNLSARFIFVFVLLQLILSTSLSYAALPTVKDGDIVSFGYTLVVDGQTIEVHNTNNPVKKLFSSDNIRPPGLYKALKGMELNERKDVVVPPEDGFTDEDWQYTDLIGKTLYYYDLQVYAINGKEITDFKTGAFSPDTFGYYFLRISLGILGAAAAIFFGYLVYKYYQRIFGKKCVICKKLAVGRCMKCGRTYCESCYSNGCPYCKSRKLVRFKKAK